MKNGKIAIVTACAAGLIIGGITGLLKVSETAWQQPKQVENSLSTGIPEIEFTSPFPVQCNALTDTDTADSNGVYSAVMLNDGCWNMIYSDFDSGTAEIMCKKRNCNHTDRDCTAFASEPGVFFTDSGRLYYIPDSQTVYEISFKDYSRKQIAAFGPDFLYRNDRIFSNGEYFFTKAWSKEDKSYYIAAISFSTGEITPLIKINYAAEFVSAEDENIYLLEKAEEESTQRRTECDCSIIKYNVSTGKTETMYTFSIPDAACCFYGSRMLYMDRNGMILKEISLSTGKERTITDFSRYGLSGDFAFRGVNKKYAAIEFLSGDMTVVDTESGKFRKNTLQRYNARTSCMEKLIPLCFTDNKAVFIEGGKTVALTYDFEGTKNTTVPYFAYISDTDYYNNSKNYTVMEY